MHDSASQSLTELQEFVSRPSFDVDAHKESSTSSSLVQSVDCPPPHLLKPSEIELEPQ